MQVALEDPGAALHVVPERLPPVLGGRARADQAVAIGGADLAAMDVGLVQIGEVEIALHEGRGLQPDGGPEMAAVAPRQFQHHPAAD